MRTAEMKAHSVSGGGWGEVASVEMTRYAKPFPRMRRRCGDACTNRATHCGCANGMALMSGCEFHVAQWVRDGFAPRVDRRTDGPR